MSYTAFVPARSGSKRLKDKNIRLLGGVPLFVRTLQACLGVAKINRVIFSTDSHEYWALAQEHCPDDRLTLDFRTADEAGDKVKIFDYLVDARDKIFEGCDGAFLLCLPTAPLRSSDHVAEAVALFETSGKPVFSACEYGFAISFAFHATEDGGWTPVSENSPMLTGQTRSQDQAPAYHPNGAIYVRSIDSLAQPGLKTLYEGAVPYLMSATDSIDVDNEIDFLHAEAVLTHRAQS